jgi:Fe-S-cluster containining protein
LLRIDSRPGFSTRLDTFEDIAKKAGEPCRFLSQHGCSIYDNRPLVCRRFGCDWLHKRNGSAPLDSPSKLGYFSIKGKRFFMPEAQRS